MKVAVLGCGLVGSAIAIDLNKDFDVVAYDINDGRLNELSQRGIKVEKSDLRIKKELIEKIKNVDYVVNALPGDFGYEVLKNCIEANKNIVDISFFVEDPFELDELAKDKNVIAVVDCGVAPGMSNILVGYGASLLDEVENVIIYVGGLPKERVLPFEYKAVFSPSDVLEEYLRPVRFIENGNLIVKSPLSEVESLNFNKIGTLEAFNTDGVRSLLKTIKAKNIKEKTLRYPGHIEKILFLKECGFFSKEPIEFSNVRITPFEFTSKILFSKWKYEKGDEDITIMRIIVEGKKNDETHRYTWDLFDEYCCETQTHSMARTTGYTATVVLRMLKSGLYNRVGVIAPEFLGFDKKCVEFIIQGLAEKNILYKQTITKF